MELSNTILYDLYESFLDFVCLWIGQYDREHLKKYLSFNDFLLCLSNRGYNDRVLSCFINCLEESLKNENCK